ncbi:uncharacterized protein LOC117781729 [Drosophila innubila]|uniref:uncharacterized protein LOC117781729 n=1 Tax=Drosophila innubila TaxID=198719 RepID=UPI00148BC698|nr:uncharacterized protein LOC117781729 [Drosophila innubila]
MNTNILDLTCDILKLICEHLKVFDDKKNFARAHPKLWDAFVEHSRKEVQSEINFESDNDHEYAENWDFFLEWWGSNLTTIDNRGECVDSSELIEIAAKFCPNLEHIVFEVNNNNIKKLEESLPKLKMLEYIEMQYFGEHTDNNLIKSLQSLTKLQSLNLKWWSLNENERNQLNELTQLEELKIECLDTDKVLLDISKILGHLRVLRVGRTQTKTLNYLAKHCTKLEKLIISDLISTNNIFIFPYFPKLTHLDIYICREAHLHRFISHLGNRYSNQIQTLGIRDLTLSENEMTHISKLLALKQLYAKKVLPSAFDILLRMPLEKIWITSLTQMDIFGLMIKCPSLKELTFNCEDINKDFIPMVLFILKKKDFQPDRPFKITMANRVEINDRLRNQMASRPHSNLLDLTLYGFLGF